MNNSNKPKPSNLQQAAAQEWQEFLWEEEQKAQREKRLALITALAMLNIVVWTVNAHQLNLI